MRRYSGPGKAIRIDRVAQTLDAGNRFRAPGSQSCLLHDLDHLPDGEPHGLVRSPRGKLALDEIAVVQQQRPQHKTRDAL